MDTTILFVYVAEKHEVRQAAYVRLSEVLLVLSAKITVS